jgi:curved DNA-binding protein CbpA
MMVDPYETLGISPQADEKEIRDRYLALVREFPPDRAPDQFALIRAAYDQLRDPAVRLRSLLFGVGKEDSIPAMIAEVRNHLRNARVPTGTLLALAKP